MGGEEWPYDPDPPARPALKIPAHLAKSVERGYFEQAWLDRLPQALRDARVRWTLDVGDPYDDPGGACSWVAPASRGREELVIKIEHRHSEAEHEVDGLRAWNGRGAVLLHDSVTTDDTVFLLLERCIPGNTLSSSKDEPAQDEIIADRLIQLWIEPEDGHPFRPLSEMTRMWIETLDDALAAQSDEIDRALVDEARRIYLEEADNCARPKLLCTDLHSQNVLAARREPWLVIDPKPIVGDPAYDPVQHMLNCLERLEDDPASLSDRMASLTGTDRARVRMWLFARAVQESLGDEPWQRRLRDVARRLAP
jgi:streptomycin 6-kinase